jgi:ribosomal protein S18 acetylase RimI-like enzyme
MAIAGLPSSHAIRPDPMAENFSFDIYSSFSELRTAMPALAQPGAHADLFGTLDWFENLLENGMEGQGHPNLLLGQHGGAAVLLPLLRGKGLRALSNYYSSLYEPACTDPAEQAGFIRAAARYLRTLKPRASTITLQPLAEDFAATAREAFAQAGYWTDTFFCFGNWTLEVAGRSFAQYHAGLPSQLRSNLERGRGRLDRAGSWSLRIIDKPGPELEDALRDYARIYAASWKEPEPHPRFIPGLCRMAAARGWLRLGVLSVAGEPGAAQLWLVKDGTASIYKLAYDERLRRYSPGSLLTAHMMARCIDEDRVRVVDYLTGDDAYKRDWMSHRRERVGLVAFDPATPGGLAAAAAHFARRAVRRMVKRTGE